MAGSDADFREFGLGDVARRLASIASAELADPTPPHTRRGSATSRKLCVHMRKTRASIAPWLQVSAQHIRHAHPQKGNGCRRQGSTPSFRDLRVVRGWWRSRCRRCLLFQSPAPISRMCLYSSASPVALASERLEAPHRFRGQRLRAGPSPSARRRKLRTCRYAERKPFANLTHSTQRLRSTSILLRQLPGSIHVALAGLGTNLARVRAILVKEGVLTLLLAKRPESQPKKITVTSK